MTIAAYIKSERLAGRFPSMPIDGGGGRYFICDSEWKMIADQRNWFNTREKAEAYRTKMLDKKVRYVY